MQHGEIGTLVKDGEQVGGFLNWHLEVFIEETSSGPHRKYTTISVKANADKFWLNREISTDKYMVIFYQLVGKELYALFQNELKVKIPQASIGEYINQKLEMES